MSNTIQDLPTESANSRYIIASAYRTLEILRAFSTPPHRFSLAELTGVMALDKGQTYRSLKTLEEAGFLRYNDEGRFSLTPLLTVLSVAALGGQSASLAELAAPQLNRLANETGESVHLFALVDDQAVCVGIRESKHTGAAECGAGGHRAATCGRVAQGDARLFACRRARTYFF